MTTEVFNRLLTIPDNKACFDCQSPEVTCASITHGIFLCPACADLHKRFLSQISQIKFLYTENWTENNLNLMILGGNIRFRNFCDIYKFPKEYPTEMRYHTVAVSYYREMLNNQVYKQLIPDPPGIEEGRKVDKSGNETTYEEMHKKHKEQDPEAEMIDKTFEVFNKMANYTKQKIKKVGETLKDPSFKEDVKFYGNKVGEMGKELGTKAYSFIKEKIDKKSPDDRKEQNYQEEIKFGNDENNHVLNEQGKQEADGSIQTISNAKDEFLEERSEDLFVKNPKKLETFDENSKNIEENKEDSNIFPAYQNNYSSQAQPQQTYQFPDRNDKFDVALDYIDKGYEKVVSYNYSQKFKAFGNGIMSFSKKTYGKVQEKWKDPAFQENMQHTKENIVHKTKEIGEKTGSIAKSLYENLKKKI